MWLFLHDKRRKIQRIHDRVLPGSDGATWTAELGDTLRAEGHLAGLAERVVQLVLAADAAVILPVRLGPRVLELFLKNLVALNPVLGDVDGGRGSFGESRCLLSVHFIRLIGCKSHLSCRLGRIR